MEGFRSSEDKHQVIEAAKKGAGINKSAIVRLEQEIKDLEKQKEQINKQVEPKESEKAKLQSLEHVMKEKLYDLKLQKECLYLNESELKSLGINPDDSNK
ncbi:MAG: hypothetical protein ABI430_02245 [Candidatus Taylorbacteria bacterium]